MDITAKELVARVAARAQKIGHLLINAEEFIIRYGHSVAYPVAPVSAPSYVAKISVSERFAAKAARAELAGAVYGVAFDGYVACERVGSRLWIDAQVDGEFVEQVILLDD